MLSDDIKSICKAEIYREMRMLEIKLYSFPFFYDFNFLSQIDNVELPNKHKPFDVSFRMEQRPIIAKAEVGADTSQEEAFQNTVLRPIIKMKHDLLIAYTKQYFISQKRDLTSLNQEKRLKLIGSCLEQDHNMRIEIRGLIIGHFTLDEFESYNSMKRAINKRISTMIKERLIDHIDLLN